MPKYFIFIALSLLIGKGFSQSTDLLSAGIEKNIELASQKESPTTYNGQILSLVSKALAQPSEQTVLHYTIKEYQKITKSGNSLQLQLSIGNFVFNDDVNYLKFSINTYLKPTLISYTYIWKDDSETILDEQSFNNKPFKNGSYLLKSTIDDVYNKANYELYLKEFSFGFDAQDVKKLDEFMSTVDAYYNSDAQLNMIEQSLDAIRIDSIEMLERSKQQTLDHINVFSRIKGLRFASKLDLDANDPIQFRSHLGHVEVRNKEIKKQLEHALENMHLTFYLKGNDWLNWGNKEQAKQFYLKSIAEKANYAPPIIALAQFNLEDKNYQAAIDTCKNVLLTLKPDTDTRYKAVKISEAVVYAYIDEINQLIDKKNYSVAINKFNLIQQYVREIPGIKNFQEFSEIQDTLYKAFYNGLAEQANLSIENGQLILAHQKIDSLANFRQEHLGVILNPSKEHELLKKLFQYWVERGRSQVNYHQPDSALFSFMQAKVLCTRYEVVYCSEELEVLIFEAHKAQYNNFIANAEKAIQNQWPDSALQLLALAKNLNFLYKLPKNEKYDLLILKANQLKYNELIGKGDVLFAKNMMNEALTLYQEAILLEKNQDIEVDTQLTGKIIETTKNLVFLNCTQAESFIEVLNLIEAKIRYSNAKLLSESYNLLTHEDVASVLNKIGELLSQGECNKALFDYNVQLNASKKFIEKREFIYASQSLLKAQQIVKQNPTCNLDATTYSSLSGEISAMLHYQKRMIQIDLFLEDKEYSDAVEEYLNLTKFYNDSCNNNFGIEHLPIKDYFLNHSNGMFIDFGVRYYVELGNLELAIELLRELHARDYIASWSKASQVDLGVKLALKDMELNPEQDPKIKVIEYSKADNWFRFLKKAYLMQWKKR